jgi:hypothetical protein
MTQFVSFSLGIFYTQRKNPTQSMSNPTIPIVVLLSSLPMRLLGLPYYLSFGFFTMRQMVAIPIAN